MGWSRYTFLHDASVCTWSTGDVSPNTLIDIFHCGDESSNTRIHRRVPDTPALTRLLLHACSYYIDADPTLSELEDIVNDWRLPTLIHDNEASATSTPQRSLFKLFIRVLPVIIAGRLHNVMRAQMALTRGLQRPTAIHLNKDHARRMQFVQTSKKSSP